MDFDNIARQLFGAKADEYKKMLQQMSAQDLEKIKQQFMSVPLDQRKKLSEEVQHALNQKIKNNSQGQQPVTHGMPGIVKVRY